MTVALSENAHDASSRSSDHSNIQLDFENLALNETQLNNVPEHPKLTDSTIMQKPDDVIPPRLSSVTATTSSSDNSTLANSPRIDNNIPLPPSHNNNSPSFQQTRIPPQNSPSFQPVQRMNYGYNNNVNRQPSTYYADPNRPPPPPPPPSQQYRPHMMSPPPPPPPPQPYNVNFRPQSYYRNNYNPQQMRPMPPPPPNPQAFNSHAQQDGSYLADSSLSEANAAGRRPKKSQFPPATKENLAMYRAEATNNPSDPRIQLDLAKFLLEAVNQLTTDDPKKTKRAKDAMTDEAQKIVKKLAAHSGMGKQGYAEAQFFLANCYGTGSMGLSTDPEKAFALYVQGSKQSHPGCTFRAAVCYEVGAGTKRDKNHAMQFYRKAANLGDNVAMYKLGMILLKGFLGQPKNPREGISWLKRASQNADEDHPHALHELGLAYEKEGIPSVIPDLNYARELFTQAAQYGYAPSQFKLGLAYENGFLNCPVDPRRSIAWYSKAAEQGDLEAEFALSGWYLTGAEGVLPQSDSEAYLWARKAADRGSAKAEYAVGYYTETGTGTRQNSEEAKRWYMRAAAQNYKRAMQRLTELKYGGAGPQQRRQHTRENNNNTSSNSKDSDCSIM